MEIEVEMKGGKEKIGIDDGATGEDLLKKLGFSPDEVLIIMDGRPLPYTEKLEGKKVRIIRVVSGG
ncbi:MAG TPA: MoaD/ThiS family protein [Thermoplasmatales archaeon]|nr:MoaD/ThiS family protein [Thermoplasmatales archaeon]